jgi:broad specificity phosphatase PhoE
VTPQRIHLIRHGQTASNAGRVFQLPETPLSEHGRDQADRLAARLAGSGISLVLASDFARAAATAERIAAATGAPLELEPLLQERNFGALRGRPYGELGAEAFAADFTPPGGESWPVFEARVDLAWRRIRALAERCEGSLAVVTHGLVCYSLASRHLRLPTGADPRRGFPNTSLTLIESAPPFAVTLLACTAHLGPRGGTDGASGVG